MKTECYKCEKPLEIQVNHNPNSDPDPIVFCSKKFWPDVGDKMPVGRFIFLDETDIYDGDGNIKT